MRVSITRLILVCWLLCTGDKCHAQFIDKQEAQLFASNVLFGGLTTGLGAVINKNNGEKFIPTFWKGFKYGCAGGVLLYTGKKCSNLIYQKNEYLALGSWSSRLIHNAGASVMENAALHRPVLSHYNLYIGFMRMEFDWQERFHFQPRVMPVSLGCFVYSMVAFDGRLNFTKSLQYASPYIESGTLYSDYSATGIAMKGNITVETQNYYPDYYYRYTQAHENVHVLQANEDLIFNTHMQPLYKQIRDKSGFINKASKYVFWDAAPIDILSYLRKWSSDNILDCYYKNPYEFEAERMATNKYLDIAELCK